MRQFISVLLSALCCMQIMAQSIAENIYTFDNKHEIVTSDKFIDTHTDRNGAEVMPYELIGQTTFNANAKEYKLQVLQYKGWQDEGGDFRVIRLYYEGEQILEFIDEESWIGDPEYADKNIWEPGIIMRSIFTGGSPFSQVLKLIGENATYTGHCIVYPLENEATALLFEGFCYGNEPPLITIIVIKGDKAKVVFNKSWFVTGLYAREKSFDLYLEDDCCVPRNLGTVRTTPEGGMTFKIEPFVEDTKVYLQPDVLPVFQGKGLEALQSYLKENVRYPDFCHKQGIQGRVIVQFVVNRDGTVSDAKVIKSVHEYLDKEALRVVNAMPYWKPGVKDGKKVRVQFTLPIIFRLQKDNAAKSDTLSGENVDVQISREPHSMTAGDNYNANQTLPLARKVCSRVEQMYTKVFADYNNNRFRTYHEYFSRRLDSLYNKLPDDEMVINADLWTWTQEFVSLALENVCVDSVLNDTAWAVVTFSDGGYKNDVRLILVSEQHGTSEKEWYIEDFIHVRNASRSIQDDMLDYFREMEELRIKQMMVDSVVYYHWNNPTVGSLDESNIIELKYTKGGIVGLFGGTTDEFDSTREGYLPGFFVLPMSGLWLERSVLSFTLNVHQDSLRNTPTFPSVCKEETDTNSRLPYEHRKMFYKKSASYRGHIHGDTISLKNLTVPYYKDTKVFVRMK